MTPAADPPAPDPAVRRKHRGAWHAAAALGSVLVLLPAGWQVWTHGAGQRAVLRGGSDGRAVTAVEIVAGAADLAVTARADADVGYRADVRWAFGRPDIERSWVGDTLRLTPSCPGDTLDRADAPGCSVRLAVSVPTGIPVTVSGTSGRITVSGLEGPVDADTGSGTLVLEGLRGPLRARSASGTLRTVGLASRQADLSAGAGRADVRFLVPPDRVTARAGTGRLDLTVPPATRYRVTSRAGAGRCEVQDGLSDPAAPRTLDLSADSGLARAGDHTPDD
ncbi:hypothetical protein ACGFXC_07175 [Streptomyces sp. NPDC048507]|uniref:hypothetical protein n=1 Tax=Streptomyces sp. NPDC048507 TaxID=3365560 RepID=UPI0037210C15